MTRPNPIQYAERLYAAIRAANFSPISFLTFGNAVKDGVELRRMPRIAAEPFMRVVGEMLDLEEATSGKDAIDADVTSTPLAVGIPASSSGPVEPVRPGEPAPRGQDTETCDDQAEIWTG